MVSHIEEVISRDEFALAITYQEAKAHYTSKEGRANKRQRKDGSTSKAPVRDVQRGMRHR